MSSYTVGHIAELLAACSSDELPKLVRSLRKDGRAGVRQVVDAELKRRASVDRETARLQAMLLLETGLRESGAAVVAGVDEVGRGALAGPVTAAAIVLGDAFPPVGLNDSKLLTPERRSELSEILCATCTCWSIAHVGPDRIDAVGIAPATREAMAEAVAGLGPVADHILVDGLPVRIHPRETAVVGGDGKSACIAAASIIAKVARDSLMVGLSEEHPGWGFHENKGYGTPEHLAELRRRGPSPIHRTTFTPVAEAPTLW